MRRRRLFAALYRFLPSLNENSTFNIKEGAFVKYTYTMRTQHTVRTHRHLVPIRSHHSTVSTINFHIHFPLK